MIRTLLLSFALGIGFGISAAEPKIVAPDRLSISEQHALQTLRDALKRCGTIRAGGEIISEIHLNRLPVAAADELYQARTEKNRITLSGGGERGLSYAVNAFLERSMGYRVWNPVESLTPPRTTSIELAPPNWSVRPAFAMRDIYNDYFATQDGGRFAGFNRINHYGDHPIDAKFGGSARFGKPYHVHTFNFYFPEKEYFAKHPEYFALLNGKRVAGPQSQLCLSNPDVARILIDKLKAYIAADEAAAAAKQLPPPRYYDVSANDNNRICTCPPCQAIIKAEGEESGLILQFINRVAKAAGEFRPDIRITTLAYMNTEAPPKNSRPRENVIIRLCNTSVNNFGAISAPENRVARAKIDRWKAIGGQLYIWEYMVFYHMPDLPYPREFDYPEMFRYYRDNNVRCLFMEHEFPERADMHSYKSYLEAKLMENPDADFNKLSADFLDGYYGKAGQAIAQYRRLLRDSVKKHRSAAFNYITSTGSFDFLDAATAVAACRLLNDAEKSVAGSPVELERVRLVRLNLDKAIYVLSRRWSAESAAPLPPELDRDAALKRAQTAWTASINKFYPEKHRARKLAEVKKEIDRFAALPAKTAPLQEFSGEPRRVDFTPELLNLHHHKLIIDPLAPSGFAVQAANVTYRSLPGGGYAVPENRSQFGAAISGNKIVTPGYHWYKFATFVPEPGGYVYLLKDWTIQIPQDSAAMRAKPGEQWDLHIRAKFDGTLFESPQSQGTGNISIDRVVLVPAKHPRP